MQSAAFFGFFYREEEEEDDGGCRFQLCRGDCFHSFTQGINSRTNTGGAAPFGSKVTFNNEMGIDRFTRRSFSGPIAYAAATFPHHSLSLSSFWTCKASESVTEADPARYLESSLRFPPPSLRRH